MKTKFYYCPKCGNVILKTVDSGVTPFCCGEVMTELIPNTTEGKTEYHLPVSVLLNPCSLKIKVGKEPHPMTQEHSIRFIYIETESRGHLLYFHPGQPAEAIISLNECPKTLYAYCNLHGLWKVNLPSGIEPYTKHTLYDCGY